MAKKKISFIDILKVIIALVPIGIKIYNAIKKAKDEKTKQEIMEALNNRDVDKLNQLIGE